MSTSTEILKRDELTEGGFAGLKEHRLVKSPEAFGANANDDGSWPGIGNFIYLADARFMPHGETRMHSHREVDVVTVLVDGRIKHEGTLEHGKDLEKNDAQIQRAGGGGFAHNEINPDNSWNRLLQLWVLPEQPGLDTDYKAYKLVPGEVSRIYGGSDKADFPAGTIIDIALLNKGQQLNIDKPYLAYVSYGQGTANGEKATDGHLIRGDKLEFIAESLTHISLIYVE